MGGRHAVELGKYEVVSMVSYGIYAEAALMHILLRLVTEGDPATPRTRYTSTARSSWSARRD